MPPIEIIPSGISGFSVGSLSSVFFYLVMTLIIFGAIGGAIIFVFMQSRYKYKIIVYRKVGSNIIRVGRYRAREIKTSLAGDSIWLIRGVKKYLPPPQIQMGKNEFWYFIREDGEWINFSLEDINDAQKKAGAYFVDTDMRMARITTERHLRNVFKKETFWNKYGSMIMNIIFLLIVTICLIVLFTRLSDLTDSINNLARSEREWIVELSGSYEYKDLVPTEDKPSQIGLIPV